MGMFGNSEEKQQEKVDKLLQKYRVTNVSADIKEDVNAIALDLAGNKAIELGAILQGNGVDAVKMSYLSAIMKQNWIIIKLLDEIAHK
jgi:hypothetical protein